MGSAKIFRRKWDCMSSKAENDLSSIEAHVSLLFKRHGIIATSQMSKEEPNVYTNVGKNKARLNHLFLLI